MFLRNQPPGRMIVGGFAGVILFGMILLLLPISVKDGAEVSAIDALFTSTSAVCVTGLIAIDTADHFTAFGQGIVAALIQIGGNNIQPRQAALKKSPVAAHIRLQTKAHITDKSLIYCNTHWKQPCYSA